MKLSIFLLLTISSTQAFALNYMCSKAVRGNSGKYKAVKSSFEYAKSNGSLASQKANFVSQIDTAINAIKNAGCPMQDPEVTKVVSPLNELKSTIASAKGGSAPAQTATSGPTKSAAKLSYSCRQVLKRQSQKPELFAKDIAYYESAVSKNVAVPVLEGLGFAHKIEASLKDIQSGACPLEHPDVSAITSKLKAQLAKIPDLTQKLTAIASNRAKKADVSNYPEFEKDFAFFVYLNDKYQDPSRYYNTNIKADWREMGSNVQDKLSFMGVNVKKPFYDFEATKDIYKNIFEDAKKYNKLMPEVEKKYAELFKTNNKIAQKYIYARDNAQKKMAAILGDHYKWITSTFPELIKINNKVVNLTVDESIKSKRPSRLRTVIIPDSLKANSQMIEILSYLAKDQSKISLHKAEQEKLASKFKNATSELAELMLKEARVPKEKYAGADKEKIRKALLEAAKSQLAGKEVLKMVMVNQDWSITNYVSWSNSTAYHHHYKDLGARCIIKENDKVAKMIRAWYRVNHKKNDKVSIWFEQSTDKDVYQDPKILIKNIN
jgi:hypothetical protein